MKKRFILGLLVVSGLSVWLSSCKDDPIPISDITFELAEESVKESDGTIQSFHPLLITGGTGRSITVKIVSDRPLEQTAVISYSVRGTAKKNSTTNPVGDFEILGNNENITILKGESEASITIKLYEDFGFEVTREGTTTIDYETIELTLESVISGTAKIGEQKTYVLTIFEDDTAIFLDWDATSKNTHQVDMDLIIWLDGEIIGASDQIGTAAEGIVIPAGFPNGTYGLGYTYYSGTSDDLKFTVDITNLGGTLNGANNPLKFNGKYTLVNINRYDDMNHQDYKGDPKISQTMTKNSFSYLNIPTSITTPASGSRTASSKSVLIDRLKNLETIKVLNFEGIGNKK